MQHASYRLVCASMWEDNPPRIIFPYRNTNTVKLPKSGGRQRGISSLSFQMNLLEETPLYSTIPFGTFNLPEMADEFCMSSSLNSSVNSTQSDYFVSKQYTYVYFRSRFCLTFIQYLIKVTIEATYFSIRKAILNLI